MATWTTGYDLETSPALDDEMMINDVSEASGTNNRMLLAYAMRQYSGTAFPVANLWDGMPFHRTDIGAGLDCFYDSTNTQWLTATEYSFWLVETTFSADNVFINPTWIGDDYQTYFTRQEIRTYVATTNTGAAYWTVTVRSRALTGSTNNVITSVDTSADSADTYVDHSEEADTATAANYGLPYFSVQKTGSPGDLTLTGTIKYRLIIT